MTSSEAARLVHVDCARRPGVALVEVDHPPANALTYDLRLRLFDVWQELRDDDSVGAVVVTGAGSRFFCAGLDLGEIADWFELEPDAHVIHERIDRLRWDVFDADLWKPTIAAINGYCVAGGWYLAQMCDVRIAAQHAEFGIPEGRFGLPAVFAWSLPQSLPLNVALESVLWSERRFSAARLYELGWLNAVVNADELLPVALDWAGEVAALPQAAIRAHKQMIYAHARLQAEELRRQAEILARPLYEDRGPAERTTAFRNRRDDARGGRAP
jgi:enoyl-CoA hydratase/carnithine racemase